MIFKELEKSEFDSFAKRYNPYTPYQTSAYGDTMEAEGYKVHYLGIADDEDIVAATMIMIKNIKTFKYAYAPKGFLIDYRNRSLLEFFTISIRKYLNTKSVVALKISPSIIRNIYDSKYELIASNPNYDTIFNDLAALNFRHLGYNNFFEALKPRFEAIIDLEKDYFSLFQKMRKEFRTKVRSAENSGVRIYKGDSTALETLYDQAKGKYPRQFNYYKNLYNNFNKTGQVEVYYAKVDFDIYLKRNQSEFVEFEKEVNIINNKVLTRGNKSNQRLLSKKMVIDKSLNASKAKLTNAIDLMNKHPDGIVIANLLTLKSGTTVTIMIDAYDKTYTSLNAKHLIIWKLIEQFAKEGYTKFNLGGITAKVDKSNKYFGLNEYKLGFGAKAYEYIGDLELVTNKPLYLMYNNSVNLFKKKK